MLDSTQLVQSAVSAFNNAALINPAFLWWAILAMPLFALVYLCGDVFMNRVGWQPAKMMSRATIGTTILTLAWVLLMGGDYNVLRDNATLLPFVIAAIVFISSMFIASQTRDIKPNLLGKKRVLFTLLVLAAIALSDTHAWWGPILQLGACAAGVALGRYTRLKMPMIFTSVAIMMIATTAVLMQPEFFRFGQLGALTIFHLAGIMSVGLLSAATLALFNVRPSGRIHNSAYSKLKWLMRFVVLLGIVLFVMTESVPVFLGTCGAAAILFAMSVWHARMISGDMPNKVFAVLLMAFGVITTMPAITALGILYRLCQSKQRTWQESKFLL